MSARSVLVSPGVLSPALRLLATQGEERRYRKNTLLMQQGDQGDTFYLVTQGQLRAFATADSGREITFGTFGPGDYLGESCLDGGPRLANVITLEASSCVVISRINLIGHLQAHPAFAQDLILTLVQRSRALTQLAGSLALSDVYGRLRQLLEHSSTPQGGTQLERLTHQEIANRIGCSREMVSRLLKDLELGGFVGRSNTGIEVLKKLPPRW